MAEFACAELGLLMGVGCIAANTMMRDALDLEHRHPAMWQSLKASTARVWKARKVAQLVHAAGLSLEQAHRVDAQVTQYVDTLSWSKFLDLLQAKIIEADPEAEFADDQPAPDAEADADTDTDHGAGHGDGVSPGNDTCPEPEPIRETDLHPSQNDADDVADDVDDEPSLCPACLGSTRRSTPGSGRLDPDKLRPKAVLYVRVSEEALRAGSGVAYCENGVGPVIVEQMREFLGHYAVSVRPVLDLRDQLPVDAYEVPPAMREALRLSRPTSVFPYSATKSHNPDFDHTVPFVPPDEGGPPGQTCIENLAPMVRFGHRVKTHGRGWRHRQPSPGVYLWRTPHGYWFRVDKTAPTLLAGSWVSRKTNVRPHRRRCSSARSPSRSLRPNSFTRPIADAIGSSRDRQPLNAQACASPRSS